eukprot:COSAG02_NODE_628_length_19343_cov_15.829297_16_plen_36_part_00
MKQAHQGRISNTASRLREGRSAARTRRTQKHDCPF